MNEDESMFASGDQDYDSAIGWDPVEHAQKNRYTHTAKLIEEDRKRHPRAYAKRPAILWAQPMRWWVEVGAMGEPMERLFGPFWTQGELAILFARTGVGKSALATQIAENLARGLRMAPFDTEGVIAAPQNVLYLDFELSTTQLGPRYSVYDKTERIYKHTYQFSERLNRSILCWNGTFAEGYEGFSDMFFEALSEAIEATEAHTVVIDNVTFLDETATSNINTALSIMRSLNQIKHQFGTSILVLAHTRRRCRWNRLSSSDLQGSINLANFADSIFGMETSRQSPELRYLKLFKIRSGEVEHSHDNVPVFSLSQFDAAATHLVQNPNRPQIANFLGMRFQKFDREDKHIELPPSQAVKIMRKPSSKREAMIERVKKMMARGKSVGEVAEKLRLPRTTVFRYKNAA
ncbi:MAG: AAA family ATPase [Pyrinomonadaceae bacterium]